MNKKYLVLFREPDGRTDVHTDEEKKLHQQHWKSWAQRWGESGNLTGGSGLTLDGKLILKDGVSRDDIHRNGMEIVGGFLLINAENIDQASEIVANCPVFEFGAVAEIREYQVQ